MVMDNKPVVNSVYEHINNGGVTFAVTNENGPTIEIQSSHFGNMTNGITLHVTISSLQNLAEMFAEAAKCNFGEEYVCATTSKIVDKNTGKIIGVGNVTNEAQCINCDIE